MLGIPVEVVLFWIISGAIVGALISDYKGRPIPDGVILGAFLGLIGILILSTQANLKDQRRAASSAHGPSGDTRSTVYRGATRELAERAYHKDARVAAGDGYVPISEAWSSALGEQVLTVVYRHDPAEVPRVLQMLADADRTGL